MLDLGSLTLDPEVSGVDESRQFSQNENIIYSQNRNILTAPVTRFLKRGGLKYLVV